MVAPPYRFLVNLKTEVKVKLLVFLWVIVVAALAQIIDPPMPVSCANCTGLASV